MSRTRKVAIAVGLLAVVFLLGFVPQWLRVRALADDLEETRFELEMARLEGQLGTALAESMRGNYEQSRQLMADFYTELQSNLDQIDDAARRQQLQTMIEDRFEVITLLSRAEAESTQRLMLLYTRYLTAINPSAESAPQVPVTPPATGETTPAEPSQP